jgi:DNA gyrase/topoisomerase IV subunit B
LWLYVGGYARTFAVSPTSAGFIASAYARSLVQVKIREVDEADAIFVELIGDVVEPRRGLIRGNALSVANLDV